MSPTKESSQFRIENVIVKPDDVRRLAKIIVKEAERLKKQNQTQRFEFEVAAEGGRNYENTSIELFEPDGVLDTKQVLSIEMSFYDFDTDSRIKLQLTHGDSSFSNDCKVSGLDSNWVNGVSQKLKDSIGELEKQTSWPRKWGFGFVVVGSFWNRARIRPTVGFNFSVFVSYSTP